jgi:hypothetical protein
MGAIGGRKVWRNLTFREFGIKTIVIGQRRASSVNSHDLIIKCASSLAQPQPAATASSSALSELLTSMTDSCDLGSLHQSTIMR